MLAAEQARRGDAKVAEVRLVKHGVLAPSAQGRWERRKEPWDLPGVSVACPGHPWLDLPGQAPPGRDGGEMARREVF
jgi:hypothetical protein